MTEPSSFRERATHTVTATVAAVATDPLGTIRGLAGHGAKTAFTLPFKIGAKAAGPALSAALKAMEIRHRRGLADSNGRATPPPAPDIAAAPPVARSATSPVPEVRTLTSAPAEVPPREAVDAPPRDIAAADLPLPDYDHLTLASLRARLVRLDLESLTLIREYEKAHANRLPVMTMLENRIAKVSTNAAGA
jgi:hypothetical protein